MEGLGPAAGVARSLAAAARQFGSPVVAVILVELLFQRAGGQAQRTTARRRLQGFQVGFLDRLPPDQDLDFLGDLGLEARREPPFLAASAEAAGNWSSSSSAHCSHSFQ